MTYLWENPYYAPFAKDSLLIYHQIIIDDSTTDFVIYSIGPDGIDNNEEAIQNFNSGKADKITFKSAGFQSSFLKLFKSYDILVLPPYGKNRDLYFEVRWLDKKPNKKI